MLLSSFCCRVQQPKCTCLFMLSTFQSSFLGCTNRSNAHYVQAYTPARKNHHSPWAGNSNSRGKFFYRLGETLGMFLKSNSLCFMIPWWWQPRLFQVAAKNNCLLDQLLTSGWCQQLSTTWKMKWWGQACAASRRICLIKSGAQYQLPVSLFQDGIEWYLHILGCFNISGKVLFLWNM